MGQTLLACCHHCKVFDLQTFALTNDCVHIKVDQVIQLLVVTTVYFSVIHCALDAQGLVALTLKIYEWRLCYRNLAFEVKCRGAVFGLFKKNTHIQTVSFLGKYRKSQFRLPEKIFFALSTQTRIVFIITTEWKYEPS